MAAGGRRNRRQHYGRRGKNASRAIQGFGNGKFLSQTALHRTVGELIPVEKFSIALLDEQAGMIHFPSVVLCFIIHR